MNTKDIIVVNWIDSYGAMSGWIEVDEYKPEVVQCVSCGFNVYEDDKIIALAPNLSFATAYTHNQANGIMVIPKVSIIRKFTLPTAL